MTRYGLIIGLLFILNTHAAGQKKLAEFLFNTHNKALNVSSAIGVSAIQLKTSSPDIVVAQPKVVTDNEDSSLFFQFNAIFNAKANNINIAIAPKTGRRIRITHIEFRLRFGSVNLGNAGVFISKDPTFASITELWTCGNNKTFNQYKDFIVFTPDTDVSYSTSTVDSIRFVISHGSNASGMYIDDFVIYGIVDDETSPAQHITVNASSTTKELTDNPAGANTCWLMDSDINWKRDVSNEERFAEMKLGALRFPYGHLADNYLWHMPGKYATLEATGPIAMTASPSNPSGWSWAVKTDGTFIKALSFDEYIAICKRQNIEPLIVINAQSHFYAGTIVTYEMLKTSAVEWVRYANITKGYGVKYWQLGNEVDHDGNFTMSTYTDLFLDFAAAMKVVDPTIKVGTGVLLNTAWNEDVLSKAGTLCDFVSAHNYQSGSKVALGGYRLWYKSDNILITNSKTMQSLLANKFSNRPEIELHITETNISGGDFPDILIIDLYKALYWFEMNMNHLALNNVKYTYYWGTHSPWNGENNIGDIRCLLENSNANTIRPAGRVIQLINTYLKDRWIDMERVSGYLRAYASVNSDKKELSLFILNKSLYFEKANINIFNFLTKDVSVEQVTFSGTGYNDTNPIISSVELTSPPSILKLPPVSLTILNYKIKESSVLPAHEEENLDLYFDNENLQFCISSNIGSPLNVYTVEGLPVFGKIMKNGAQSVNLMHLPIGVYIAKLQDGKLTKSIKFIKQ